MLTEESLKRSQARFKYFDLSVNLILRYYFISLCTLSLFSAYQNYGGRLFGWQLQQPHEIHRPEPAMKAWRRIWPCSSCFDLFSQISSCKVYGVYGNSCLHLLETDGYKSWQQFAMKSKVTELEMTASLWTLSYCPTYLRVYGTTNKSLPNFFSEYYSDRDFIASM